MVIDETNKKQHEYVTYPSQFISFRWYKPLLTGAVIAALFIGFSVAIGIIYMAFFSSSGFDLEGLFATGYDDMNVYTAPSAIANLGSLAVMIPILALASLIVRDRPFSSYSSARGGWDHVLFFKCLLVCIPTVAIPIIVDVLIEGALPFNNSFTVAGFIALTLLCPLQCMAEEYLFRGLIMQTLGSWVRIPILAILIQAAAFAALHPYNLLGVIAIVISGASFGLAAWIGRGLEASSAIHVANNMTAFYLTGFGFATISSEQNMATIYLNLATAVLPLTAYLILGKKFHWFDHIRRDDAVEWNAKIEAKRAAKAARKEAGIAKAEAKEAERQENVSRKAAEAAGARGKHDIRGRDSKH